jgi:oxygen-independent coproporphyrinogen-3 oxidase
MLRRIVQQNHHTVPESIYIHVPFCRSKCPYCSFYSVPYDKTGADRYIEALGQEMALAERNDSLGVPQTLYIGGGTPSIFDGDQFARFLETLCGYIPLTACREWTIEANPDSLTRKKLETASKIGVNRISLGVQAADNQVLEMTGRGYTVSGAQETLEFIRQCGIHNIGIDLIAGMPKTVQKDWRKTLEWTCDQKPSHVSVYALSVESPCRWFNERVKPPGEVETMAFVRSADEMLEVCGLSRYEISNYARDGFACQHNLIFWRGGDYRGFGPAASSRIGTSRFTNVHGVDEYSYKLSSGKSPAVEKEELPPEVDAGERLAFALRLREGVDLDEFAARIGAGAEERLVEWENELQDLARAGLTGKHGSRWALSERGRWLADRVGEAVL